MSELTTKFDSMEVDLTINAKGIDEAVKELDLVLKTPLVEITTDEQFERFKAIKNSFEMTEKGITQGVIPTIKKFVSDLKARTGVLATLEDYSAKSVAFKNKVEGLLKDYTLNKFKFAVSKTWEDMALTYELVNDEVKAYNQFFNLKNKVETAIKGMSSEEKKLEKLKLVAEEFKNWITSKDKEVSLIKKAITDKVKVVYQDEVKRLVNVDVDLATNLSMIDDFVAKKEALEVALAEEEAKKQAELAQKKAEQEAIEQAKETIPEPAKQAPSVAKSDVEPQSNQDLEPVLNKKIIYYSDDLKAELNAIFAKYEITSHLDGVLIERRD